MPEEKDFYSEMLRAVAAGGAAAEVSDAVWRELCGEARRSVPPPVPPSAPVAVPPSAPIAAASSDDLGWAELEAKVLACSACGLRQGCRQVVFGEGDRCAELMFIGEGPGHEEDVQGRPFVGPAGKLLDKMIAAMNYAREEVYIANVVKCRPPGNRVPEPDEAACCAAYLNRQIDLVKPKVLVLLGATPLKYLTGKVGIKHSRGVWCEYRGIRTMPTFHPAYLLRVPEDKRPAWNDLKQVMAVLGK